MGDPMANLDDDDAAHQTVSGLTTTGGVLAYVIGPIRGRLAPLRDLTAQLLADNRMIGWFQGRMEYGPRSLGAGS